MKEILDRAAGCLIGGAIGDALGWLIEFDNIDLIRREFGPEGLSGFRNVTAHITDDTQMTLYTAEGLMRMFVREKHLKMDASYDIVLRAYHRWLSKQGYSVDIRSRGTEYRALDQSQVNHLFRSGFLVGNEALNQNRSPGRTCTGALKRGRRYTFDDPYNRCFGCGGVMRAAPAGILNESPVRSFLAGCNLAVLTHGHPIGYQSAGVLASIICLVLKDQPLTDAVDGARAILNGQADCDELSENDAAEYRKLTKNNVRSTDNYIQNTLSLAGSGRGPEPELIEKELGAGWTGGEALSIALYCALSAGDDFEKAILMAVNHSSDSDSTGAICGNILGAAIGEFGLPDRLRHVELYDLIKEMAWDLVMIREDVGSFVSRYPGW